MIVSVTQFQELARDLNGAALPLGRKRMKVDWLTGPGTIEILAGTRLIRIAADTPMSIAPEGSPDLELFMPGVEYMAVTGGEVLAIAAT